MINFFKMYVNFLCGMVVFVVFDYCLICLFNLNLVIFMNVRMMVVVNVMYCICLNYEWFLRLKKNFKLIYGF